MQTFFRVVTLFFALGTIGSLMDEDFHPSIIVIMAICAYFGWMHDFKKSESKGVKENNVLQAINKESKPVLSSFSEAQKHALICCLYVISISDDELHPNEISAIGSVSELIKYENIDFDKIRRDCQDSRDMILEIIHGFDKYQLNFLFKSIDKVIKSDGLELEMEFIYVESILHSIGLDFQTYLRVNNRKDPFNPDAYQKNWKSSFNETQKKAILFILYGIAVDDNLDFSDTTSRCLGMNMNMLGCRYELDELQDFVYKIDKQVTEIIFGMGEQQKKVFLMFSCSMGRARKLDTDKILELEVLMQQCGINSEEFFNEYYK
jgi:hypothetical protein